WTENFSTSFTWQRGYRAGGTDVTLIVDPTNPVVAINEFDPEFTSNFEIALRSQWFDRRLTANANVFYTRWTDQQVRVDVDPTNGTNLDIVTQNAGKSRLIGGELFLSGRPVPELELFGSVGVSDTEFLEFNSNGVDFSGNRFSFAPIVQASFGGTYFFDNGVFAGADASYTGATFSGINNLDSGRVASRFLVNAELGYEAENWSVAAYIRNLFDTEYLINRAANGGIGTPGEPLTFGLVANVYFP
ncbi:MAG: TonB-dependent receptor, partial [Pseudomonadota bacterium]